MANWRYAVVVGEGLQKQRGLAACRPQCQHAWGDEGNAKPRARREDDTVALLGRIKCVKGETQ